MPYSEVLHIRALREGGLPVSRNMVVLCPNHHSIIRVARPSFNRELLRFDYRNGLREHLELTTHLT